MTSKRQRGPWQRLWLTSHESKRSKRAPLAGPALMSERLGVRRMLAAGDPDPTFGTGTGASTGEVIIPFSPTNLTDSATTMKIQPDGNVIAGNTLNPSRSVSPPRTPTSPSRGSIRTVASDTTFGVGGKVTLPIGLSEDKVSGIALQSNGDIIVAGYYYVWERFDRRSGLRRHRDLRQPRRFAAEDVGTNIRVVSPGPWLPGTYKITSVNAGEAQLDASPAPVGTPLGSWFADKYDIAVVRLTPSGTMNTGRGRVVGRHRRRRRFRRRRLRRPR